MAYGLSSIQTLTQRGTNGTSILQKLLQELPCLTENTSSLQETEIETQI